MVECITAVTLKEQVFVIVVATHGTGLVLKFFLLVFLNKHGGIDICNLGSVADSIRGDDWAWSGNVSKAFPFCVRTHEKVTSNFGDKIYPVEALATNRATVRPFDPWF